MECPNFDSYVNVCACECYESKWVQIVLTDIVLRKSEMINQLTTTDTRNSDQWPRSYFLITAILCPMHTLYVTHNIGNMAWKSACDFNELLNDSDDFEHGHLWELAPCKHTDVFLGGRVW